MTEKKNNKYMFDLSGYVKVNWGSPFIAVAITLLTCAVVSLSTGASAFADTLVMYALYPLVLGVVLQFLCYLKYKESDQKEAF